MFTRYAIYFVPDAAWGDFGATWLGWKIHTGTNAETRNHGIPDHSALTDRPRKYGFHATIKAPFRLADTARVEDMHAQAITLCATLPPIPLTSLGLSRIGRFFALTAPAQQEALVALSGQVVRAFDPFRAPLTDAELARRRKSRLSDAQDALLGQWGYPYVMEEFRFHMTLTGPARYPDLVEGQISAALQDILQIPLTLDALSLVGETEDGHFQQIERFALLG